MENPLLDRDTLYTLLDSIRPAVMGWVSEVVDTRVWSLYGRTSMAAHDAATLAASADVLLGLSAQVFSLDTQVAASVLAGPVSGAAAAPTFRALASTDIPALAYDPTGTAASAVSVHAALQTGVHGLAISSGKTLTATDSTTLANASVTLGNGSVLTLTTSLTNQGAAGVLAWGGAYTLTIPATGTAALLSTVWALAGNAGTVAGTNFVGTTDDVGLVIKVNNAQVAYFAPHATSPNIVMGYSGNSIVGSSYYGNFIGGGGLSGSENKIGTVGSGTIYSVIVGGYANTITVGGVSTTASVIVGGVTNTISRSRSVIVGGQLGVINSDECFIGGGYANEIGASSEESGIVCGYDNHVGASSQYAVVLGGAYNLAGASYTLVGGRRGKANHAGVFLWADSVDADFDSVAVNEVAIRARGGFRHAYDGSNYWTASVSSAGAVTFDAIGSSAGFTISDAVTVAGILKTTDTTDATSTTTGALQSAGGFGCAKSIVIGTGYYVGLGASAGRVVFTDAATDTLALMSANVGIGIAPGGLVHVAGSASAPVYIDAYNTSTGYSNVWMRKSQSDTVGTLAATTDNKGLGGFFFQGVKSDNSAFCYGAYIYVYQTGAAGASSVGARMAFVTYDASNNAYTMTLDNLGNLGIGTSTFGTSASSVFAIKNGAEPSSSPVDIVQIYSVDLSAGNATLGLRTETSVVTESVVSDRTLSIRVNGTTYKLCLKA
jgi:hypothetical protein